MVLALVIVVHGLVIEVMVVVYTSRISNSSSISTSYSSTWISNRSNGSSIY